MDQYKVLVSWDILEEMEMQAIRKSKKWRLPFIAFLIVILAVPLVLTTMSVAGDVDPDQWTVSIGLAGCNTNTSDFYIDGFGEGKKYDGDTFIRVQANFPFNFTLHANGTTTVHTQAWDEDHTLVVGANILCCMVVDIPDDFAANGGDAWIDGIGNDENPITDLQSVALPSGVDVQWYLRNHNNVSQKYTKHVDCSPLVASEAMQASTCDMEIIIPQDLADAGATVRVQGFGAGLANGTHVQLPVGVTVDWDFTVNGKTSPTFYKHIDCTPLEILPCMYCPMQVLMPWDLENANARVRIVSAGDQWYHGDICYLPTGIYVEWSVIVNGFEEDVSHLKYVDCTPLVAGCAPTYCAMEIDIPDALVAQGASIRIVGLGPGHTDGEVIVLPIGETIQWYLTVNNLEGPVHEKHIDCTPLTVTGNDYRGLTVSIAGPPGAHTLQIKGCATLYTKNDIVYVPFSNIYPGGFDYRVDGGGWTHRTVPPGGNIS